MQECWDQTNNLSKNLTYICKFLTIHNLHHRLRGLYNSVHWMGRDFSSNGWMCVDLCSPFCCWSFLWLFFFFGNSEITCPATYYLPSWPYLPTKNQLPPATYLLDSHPLFPPKCGLSVTFQGFVRGFLTKVTRELDSVRGSCRVWRGSLGHGQCQRGQN
jgi:hypothetical protein